MHTEWFDTPGAYCQGKVGHSQSDCADFMARDDDWQMRCLKFPRAIVLHLCELGSEIKYQVQKKWHTLPHLAILPNVFSGSQDSQKKKWITRINVPYIMPCLY